MKRVRPNFFFAVQISNPEIHQKLKDLQNEIIQKEPSLLPALIPIQKSHITLAVTHLSGDNEISALKDKFMKWGQENIDKLFQSPATLSFSGINTFPQGVAFVKLDQDDGYLKLRELTEAMMEMCEEELNHKFNPHLTIVKLNRETRYLLSCFRTAFEHLKKGSEDKLFGTQEIKSIQLLKMGEVDEIGYYKCYGEVYTSQNLEDLKD